MMIRYFLAALFSIPFLASAGTVSDSNLGYTITLPANWVQVKAKANQHYFRDSTRQHHSQISILKYAIDKASYPTPENWTQAQFIAYKLSVETSSYPFGAVAYFDSTAATKLGPVWAPEAFSVLYPADGDPTYCEFIRYCAIGEVGYEIYAIGDSADMAANVDYYAGIIASLQFSTPVASLAKNLRATPDRMHLGVLYGDFDLIGRHLRNGNRAFRPISVPTR
jgi:hypothetical protein